MPVYVETLTVPPNTPEDKPVIKTITIEPGVVHRWEVLFPAGCHALVRFAVLYGETHIFPRGKGNWIRGNNETVSMEDRWMTPDIPTTLRLVGWSEDEYYPHTLYVRIGVLPPEEISTAMAMRELSRRLAESLRHMLGYI